MCLLRKSGVRNVRNFWELLHFCTQRFSKCFNSCNLFESVSPNVTVEVGQHVWPREIISSTIITQDVLSRHFICCIICSCTWIISVWKSTDLPSSSSSKTCAWRSIHIVNTVYMTFILCVFCWPFVNIEIWCSAVHLSLDDNACRRRGHSNNRCCCRGVGQQKWSCSDLASIAYQTVFCALGEGRAKGCCEPESQLWCKSRPHCSRGFGQDTSVQTRKVTPTKLFFTLSE